MIDYMVMAGFLGIAVACNWLLAFYKKIGVEKVSWNWQSFFEGMAKVVIIALCIVAVGFIWHKSPIDLSGVGLQPQTLLSAGIIYYFGKIVQDLSNIINIKQSNGTANDTSNNGE